MKINGSQALITAGWELHPTPKMNILNFYKYIIAYYSGKNNTIALNMLKRE